MSKKIIPAHLREFLEHQIVRKSRGYEFLERILASVTEEDLKDFLEWYENTMRSGLTDADLPLELDLDKALKESGREKKDILGLGDFARQVVVQAEEDEKKQDSLFNLARKARGSD